MKKLYFLVLLLVGFVCGNGQNIYFPDPIFKDLLLNENIASGEDGIQITLDLNGDNEISQNEAMQIYTIQLYSSDITDLTGIEYFNNLVYLEISSFSLTNLNLSGLSNLNQISLSSPLTSIDLSGLFNLTYLDLNSTELSTIDLSDSNNLNSLSIDGPLISLEISELINLNDLLLFGNQYSSLDLSQNSSLENVEINGSLIQNIDFTGLNNIVSLHLNFNEFLSNVDLSDLVQLVDLSLRNNNLSNLDISNQLLLYNLDVSQNNLQTLNLNGLNNIENLKIDDNLITEIDLNSQINLITFSCGNNNISNLDFLNNINLSTLKCPNNELINLDLSNLPSLYILDLSNNEIEFLDLSNSMELYKVLLPFNNLIELDLSNNTNLDEIDLEYNQMESINFKNSILDNWDNPLSFYDDIRLNGNENLHFICADQSEINYIVNHWQDNYPNLVVNSYCSFTPGGEYFEIQGNSQLDLDANGCDVNDTAIPNLQFEIINTEIYGTFYGNQNGEYYIPVQVGTHNVTPVFENPYFTANPTNFSVDFPADASQFVQDICVSAAGNFNDLEITLIPIGVARPDLMRNTSSFTKTKEPQLYQVM